MRDTALFSEQPGVERIVWLVLARQASPPKDPLAYLELQGLTIRPESYLDGIIRLSQSQNNGTYHGSTTHSTVVFNLQKCNPGPNEPIRYRIEITGIQSADLEYLNMISGEVSRQYRIRSKRYYSTSGA